MEDRKYILAGKRRGFNRLPRSRLCLSRTRRLRLKRGGLPERKGSVD
jgi:hypothetical protein